MQHENLKTDYFRAVERALYDFPGVKAQLKQREQWIEAMCAGNNCADIIQTGACSTKPVTAVQERTVEKKESDPLYLLLASKVRCIQEAYNSMSESMRDLVRLRYWRGLTLGEVMAELAISEREFYRRRRRAVQWIAPFIVGPWGM